MIRVVAATEQVSVPTESFLAEIQKRPCLWDPTHTLYWHQNARKLAFRLIADKLIDNVPESKKDEMGNCLDKKWRGIREHYMKIKRDPSKIDKYSNNRYFQLLAFLEPTLPASSLDKAEGSHAGKSPTSHSNSPTNETSVTSASHDDDPGSDPRKRTTHIPKRKHTGQSQSTVVIDGVEFEQVTLANGEVIVKLKEEVLEGCPSPKIMDTEIKKRLAIPVMKRLQPQGNHGKQRADRRAQMGHQNEHNGNQAPHHGVQSPMFSESLHSENGLDPKRIQHSEGEDRQPPNSELKITSTTSLSSAALVSLPNCELKITSTSTLSPSVSQEVTHRSDENRSPDIESPYKKANTRTMAEKKFVMIEDQNMDVSLGSVDDMIESVTVASKQAFHKLGGVLKSTGKAESLLSISKKETAAKRADCTEIPDDENGSNLTPRGAKNESKKPAIQRDRANFLEHWNAELKRLAALPKTDVQQRDSSLNGQEPKRRGGRVTTKNVSNDSRSVDSQKSSQDLMTRTVKTNRNTEVLEKISSNSPSADDQNASSNRTSTKRIRTNRNTVIAENLDSNDSGSEGSTKTALKLTPGKTLLTNRNTLVRTDDASDSSDDQETPGLTPIRGIKTNRNTVIEEEPESLPTQPSNHIEILEEDEETISKNHRKIDSPDADEDKIFLLSLLPEMKSMTETQNYEFRLEVMQALTRTKFS